MNLVEPLRSYGVAQIGGDTQLLGALARFHPRRDLADRVLRGMRNGVVERSELRQPFEVAARRKDDPKLARVGTREHVGGARPEQMYVFGRVDARLARAVGQTCEKEMRVERPRHRMVRAPARKGHQLVEIVAQIDRGFLARFADRGDTRGGIVGLGMTRRSRMILGIDPPARKHDRAARKAHRRGALDEQMLGTVGPVAKQDERGGGDRVGHATCDSGAHRLRNLSTRLDSNSARAMAPNMVSFDEARRQIVAVGRWLDGKGWAPATAGNYSMRLDDGSFAVTVSGRHKGRLTESDVMRVAEEGASLDGQRPSAETLLHLHIYQLFPLAGAVLHSHSPDAVGLSRAVAAFAFELAGHEMLKVLPGVATHDTSVALPIVDNSQDMAALAACIEPALLAPGAIPAYLIRSHGLYGWGRDMAEAERVIEGIEWMIAAERSERAFRR